MRTSRGVDLTGELSNLGTHYPTVRLSAVLTSYFDPLAVCGRSSSPRRHFPGRSLRLFPFQVGLWLNRPRHVPCPVDETVDDGDAVGPLQVQHAPGTPRFIWPSSGLSGAF